MEPVSATAEDEMERRARIVAGRYQALAHCWRWLSLRRPLFSWQLVSHKFFRPLLPFAMLGALAANLASLLPGLHGEGLSGLGPPWNWVLLACQALFYTAAFAGPRLNLGGKAGKLLYVPTFLVSSNLSALMGLWRFVKGGQSSQWRRVQRRGDEP